MQKQWIGVASAFLILALSGCQSTPEVVDEPKKEPLKEVNVIERDASISMSELSQAGAAMRLPNYEDTLYDQHLGGVASESDRRNALPPADLLSAQEAESKNALKRESERLNQKAKQLQKPKRVKGDKSYYAR